MKSKTVELKNGVKLRVGNPGPLPGPPMLQISFPAGKSAGKFLVIGGNRDISEFAKAVFELHDYYLRNL